MLEDNDADVEMIQRQLRKENLPCEFGLATHKGNFLIALDQFRPDIILSDHSLPQFNSVEALTIARKQFPGIPFIIVTGTVSEEFAADIMKLGADDYILKDRLARLPSAIITTVQRRRSDIERQEAMTAIKMMEQGITDQKILEQKKIARTIMNTQEKERNYLGQELHDNINQILVSAKMYLEAAANKNGDIKEMIKYPIDLIDKTIEEIRLLSSKLATPLKNISLQELCQQLVNDLGKNPAVKTGFEYNLGEFPLSEELKLNVFRIIQEQLNNIAKHAAADNVTVSIEAADGFIHIVVTDDGKGFDINQKRNGIGISNILNRVEAFNGEVLIESSPGQGSMINCKIPVESATRNG
ncbi:MAG: hypothetical protein JWQ78_65 [Sediminibacterium sp.]|nr:hypothetical protein [Sediminibacterium sp.]